MSAKKKVAEKTTKPKGVYEVELVISGRVTLYVAADSEEEAEKKVDILSLSSVLNEHGGLDEMDFEIGDVEDVSDCDVKPSIE